MLSALYYPFSRCVDVATLKQLLLVFDSVTFLDPIEDDEWRAYLFRQLEHQEDPRFDRYRHVEEPLKILRQEEVIQLVTPERLQSLNAISTSASAVSDLLDADWCRVASDPSAFDMPHRRLGLDGATTWQIFPAKLPDQFREVLLQRPEMRGHLARTASEESSWTLSYEAGSAITMSLHLAAADELLLAPVTDSVMHHRLMLRKLHRALFNLPSWQNLDSTKPFRLLAEQTALALVDQLMPRKAIEQVSFDQILRFREETNQARRQFLDDIKSRFERTLVLNVDSPDELLKCQREIESDLEKELADYNNSLASARDTLWPQLVGTATKGLGSGGLAAVALQLIWPGMSALISGSILAASLTLLTAALEHRAAVKKVERSASPSVAYLSRILAA